MFPLPRVWAQSCILWQGKQMRMVWQGPLETTVYSEARQQAPPPKCQHCYGQHSTTFAKCPKRMQIIEERKQKRAKTKEKTIRFASKVRPGMSCASAVTHAMPSMLTPAPRTSPDLVGTLLNMVPSLVKTVNKMFKYLIQHIKFNTFSYVFPRNIVYF